MDTKLGEGLMWGWCRIDGELREDGYRGDVGWMRGRDRMDVGLGTDGCGTVVGSRWGWGGKNAMLGLGWMHD